MEITFLLTLIFLSHYDWLYESTSMTGLFGLFTYTALHLAFIGLSKKLESQSL